MLAVGGVALAGAFGAGWVFRGDIQNSRLGKDFVETLTLERQVAIRREVNLWTQIGDERRARMEMIGTFQRIDELSAEARANMMTAMRRERETTQAALAQAQANIQELKDAASQMAKDWKAGVIPPDITCGVFNAAGCPEPSYPTTSADRDEHLDVRDGSAGQGGDP
jgi:hypothetical protein